MSDTSNPGNLASAAEFDARLKRADENRWLATRYAPPEARQLLIAIYLLHHELSRALHAKEAMLGKIRIQWWRETIDQIASKSSIRRHDLAEELGCVIRNRTDLVAPLHDLINRFDDIIDDHLRSAGHEHGGAHETRHLAAEGALTRLAGQALHPSVSINQLDALTRCGEAYLAVVADTEDAADRWVTARVAAGELSPPFWPAILHLSVGSPPGKARSPLSKRWRMFQAALTHRL